ncbi:MAG: aldehyde dehydrogenase (NADP(+)) [Acidobacteriaceae bacterium]|nr:aldehyde dehydrogenase (NADP(+)) [Acidobacteriaceae bacterium]
MQIHGKNLIGLELSASGDKRFSGYNPRENRPLAPEFHEADASEVTRAMELAAAAAPDIARMPSERIANFLGTIREQILVLGDELIETADRETALGLDRLRGERDRTANQIKLFADIVTEGSWVDARIDTALPDRKPLPRPDIRRMLRPIGTVVVFGASNFPLAFSVAGGDTASAFAAGNPVVVKAHPAHPATSEMVGTAIIQAVKKSGMPDGTFSMLHGFKPDASIALVEHPKTAAVGFTGSQRAGRALFDAAAKRPDPISVYAEMGSVNPVFILNDSLKADANTIADGLYRSVLLGVGQFCTCPGLVFLAGSDRSQALLDRLTALFRDGQPGTMLNSAIRNGYTENLKKAAGVQGVQTFASNRHSDTQRTEGTPALLVTDSASWLPQKELHEEIFGPATIAVRCRSDEELRRCAKAIEGSLTATIHGTPEELMRHRDLIEILSAKAGRLIFNGYPTGVEVGYAMHHGGPYPSTTDVKFTSVGAAAIYRFARPVCYQNFPEALLPPELANANPRKIWRMVNGQLTRDPL